MFRIHILSLRIGRRLEGLSRIVPPLGAPLLFEQCRTGSMINSGRPSSRNRWNRNDLESAIGHDPHEAEAAGLVWPPANRAW
jgi:hypothetical protein